MAFYKIYFRESVQKDLKQIPQNDVKKIFNRVYLLESEPRPYGCEKLKGQERYRIRQGDYRIIYSIIDKELVIWIVKIGHRKDIYRFSN
jgi:mRNA interferase RelE/StbE